AVFYKLVPTLPARLAQALWPVYRFLLNKWYFDELYDFIFVRPYAVLARALWKGGEEGVVEGMPLDAVRATRESAVQAVRLQTGSLALYAFSMLGGLVVLLTVALCG
ncbi:MAG: NADH-quinone oxidoreductase subunit L, partial [Acetobacter papayae]